MEQAEATELLRAMTAAGTAPVLESFEVEALLGRHATDDGWDLDAAASEGWAWKQGRVSDRYDYSADGRSMTASQMFEHCGRMRDYYAAKGEGVMQLLCIDVGCAE